MAAAPRISVGEDLATLVTWVPGVGMGVFEPAGVLEALGVGVVLPATGVELALAVGVGVTVGVAVVPGLGVGVAV